MIDIYFENCTQVTHVLYGQNAKFQPGADKIIYVDSSLVQIYFPQNL